MARGWRRERHHAFVFLAARFTEVFAKGPGRLAHRIVRRDRCFERSGCRRGAAPTKGRPPTGEETRMFKVVEAVFYVAGALLIIAQVASIISLANHV
jgi:hypothetical protein